MRFQTPSSLLSPLWHLCPLLAFWFSLQLPKQDLQHNSAVQTGDGKEQQSKQELVICQQQQGR